MPSETDWEARKREFWTQENLRRKTEMLFPGEDSNELLGIFASLEDGWSQGHERLGLAILRCCEEAGAPGNRAVLERLIQTAREDYRHLLMIEYLEQAELPDSATPEQKTAACEADARECLEWLQK